MKKLLVFGVIVLFLGLAIAPSINANIRELSVDIPQENDTLQLESEFQRVRAYIEMQFDEDCGCGDANKTQWFFPMICTLLFPAWCVAGIIVLLSNGMIWQPVEVMAQIGLRFNCYWLGGSPWEK